MKTMICDLCGEVGDRHGDVVVGRYHVTFHLQNVTTEEQGELKEAVEGYIDMCESCADTYMEKITEDDV